MERFTEDQAQRIFARAARRQHAARTPDGLTRDDLEAVAREAGLDPAFVAEAIVAERVEGEATDGRRVRVLPSDVSDREWETIVDLLRSKAGGPGVAQQVGRRREWTAPGPTIGGVPVASVELTPAEEGTVIAVVPRKSSSPKAAAWWFSALALINAAIYGAIVYDVRGAGAAAVLVSVLLLFAVASPLVIPALMRRKQEAAAEKIDGLLDRIDLLARADDARPLLDLDALPDALEGETARPQGRTRV